MSGTTVCAAVVAAAGVCAGAWAQTHQAFLNGANERPVPVVTPGFGYGSFILNGLNLSWNITWQDMTGPATVAHIHKVTDTSDPLNSFGGVVLDFGNFGPITSPMIGMTTISQQLANDIDAGFTYVNIHSMMFPGGELRGQIEVIPSPGAAALLGLGGLMAVRRRRG